LTHFNEKGQGKGNGARQKRKVSKTTRAGDCETITPQNVYPRKPFAERGDKSLPAVCLSKIRIPKKRATKGRFLGAHLLPKQKEGTEGAQ